MFDALAIEHAFRAFMGNRERGGLLDADVFRLGDPKDLGDLVLLFAGHLRRRTAFLEFAPVEECKGGAKPRLEVAIERLTRQGETLKQRPDCEPEEYHWQIIGSLVLCITALLQHLEGTGPAE